MNSRHSYEEKKEYLISRGFVVSNQLASHGHGMCTHHRNTFMSVLLIFHIYVVTEQNVLIKEFDDTVCNHVISFHFILNGCCNM